MIEECTKDNYKTNCGNCVHGTTNGFYAPNIWCDQYPNKGKNEPIQPYCYCNESHMGTTCEKFSSKTIANNKMTIEETHNDCVWKLLDAAGNFIYATDCKVTTFAYNFMQTYEFCPYCGKPVLMKAGAEV